MTLIITLLKIILKNDINSPITAESVNEDTKGEERNPDRKFSLRSDVIKKTILRSFKQFYRNEFKEFFNFTTKSKRPSLCNSEMFLNANRFVKEKLGIDDSQRVAVFVVAIVDTKRKYACTDPSFALVRNTLMEAIRKFN
jgi:hypothetical protein